MHAFYNPLFASRKVQLRSTLKPITPFGGLVSLISFFNKIGLPAQIRAAMPFCYRSPNAIDPAQTLVAFLISVVAGARRLAHTDWLRADRALHALLGIERFPGTDTVGIEELKNDLQAQGFCMQDFFAAESAFLAVRFTFNPLSLHQQLAAPKERQGGFRRPATLRTEAFLGGAVLGNRGRQPALCIAESWGGLEKRKPLLESVLRRPPWSSPK